MVSKRTTVHKTKGSVHSICSNNSTPSGNEASAFHLSLSWPSTNNQSRNGNRTFSGSEPHGFDHPEWQRPTRGSWMTGLNEKRSSRI